MSDPVIEQMVAKSRKHGWILEPDAKALLKHCEIPVPRFELAANADAAVDAARRIGYPVAVKVVSPDVVHKTEVNGVVLGLSDDAAVRTEFERFAVMDGFVGMLVEEMVAPGKELIIGGKNDPQFGPVVLLGIGGTGVEIYNDTALRMAPLVSADVEAMIHKLTGRELIHGFRGGAALDIDSIINTVVRFSELMMILGTAVESLDLNPVICTPTSLTVVDARVILMMS